MSTDRPPFTRSSTCPRTGVPALNASSIDRQVLSWAARFRDRRTRPSISSRRSTKTSTSSFT